MIVEDFENLNPLLKKEGEVIGELLLDRSGISSSSNLCELTLREQSPIRAPAATCKSQSGQHFKTTQPPPLQNYSNPIEIGRFKLCDVSKF